MQEVYPDGSRGEIRDFDPSELEKSLEKSEVDHVEVFKKGTPAHAKAIKRIKKRAKKKGIIK
ncbi:MAG: hypothetical protein JRI41_08125 [Deltaproteobacteria bacterium]|nr:hypothetical protein [Deltaproteobacteria bacterium]